MTGIIDIGSNTIRLVIYKNGKCVKNIGIRSDIISNTTENILSKDGIENLCENLLFLISKADCEKIYIIATEAVRNLINKEKVKSTVYDKTGIYIDILTGEEEAEYVFLGIQSEISEKEGICVDIGGGSVEIIAFENGKKASFKSYPLGCKKLKNEFVKGNIPNDAEMIKINEILEKEIEKYWNKGNLYMTGGTAKACISLNKSDKNILSIKDIESIYGFIKEIPEENLKQIFPNRYDTIAVGVLIMKKIAEIYNKKEINIINNGIREGYLMKKL